MVKDTWLKIKKGLSEQLPAHTISTWFDPINAVAQLGFFIPSLAVGARRLHDTNRSGWWQLIAFTIIGLIPLIIWLASVGEKKKNKYGQPIKLKSIK